MSTARPLFIKTTIAVALTAVFSQVVDASELTTQNFEKSISLIKKAQAKVDTPIERISLASLEQGIAAVLESNPSVLVAALSPNGLLSLISVGGTMGLANATIMEDGINHAPLAYLDNSLTNISLGTVESIEVMSAPGASFGPNGLGGLINISRQKIPSQSSVGSIELGYGTHQQALANFSYGSLQENWGSLVSFNREQGDSYRVNQAGDAGDFTSNDFLLRIKEIAPPTKKNWQQTELKIQYKDHRNNESRFGISRDDLSSKPMTRYMATALDNEYQEQLLIHLKHQVRLEQDELISTDIYYNDGEAGFYQTANINGLHGDVAANVLGQFEQNPNGNLTLDKIALDRTYSSWGVQFQTQQQIAQHQVVLGVRYHSESMIDKLRVDEFNLDSQLLLSQTTFDADTAIYKDTAKVKSVFLTDFWQVGRVSVNVGVRHEQIEMRREGSNIIDDVLGANNQNITLFNGDISYQMSPNWSWRVSAYQGYQPTRATVEKSLAQESLITRATVEYASDNVHLSISLFNNDFDHLQGNCLGATDCDNSSINVGEANVKGAEVKLSTVWQVSNFELPIELAYTHNDGQYQRDFNRSSGGWQINRGDLLPYIPDNHLYFKIGLRARNWQISAQATYRGVARTSPGANINQANAILDDVALLNIQASYAVSNAGLITLAINNVTDEVYAQSSFQAGLLAGNERTVSLRYKYRF